MGRPPSGGGPAFRFNHVEVAEMDAILLAHSYAVPSHEILDAIAQRFSNSSERTGKVEVSAKQVWNWFQNRRYALRAKATKAPEQINVPSVPRDDQAVVRNLPQNPQSQPAQTAAQIAVRNASENPHMEFEAKSARDGAWYDVALFLSHRSFDSGDPEALVRFAGFGQEEDEWVNIRRHVRQRSLPCESSECVAVLPGDLTLCFQEGKEQALYFDAHVLDAQRRRHDVRGCRCRFLEIVPLRKVCRRPETDYRLQQLHAGSANTNQQKLSLDLQGGVLMQASAPAASQKLQKTEEHVEGGTVATTVPHSPVPGTNESVSLSTKTAELINSTAIGGLNPIDTATATLDKNSSKQQV